MNLPLYMEQVKPDLPSDRVRAAITIMTLVSAQTSYDTLIAAIDPAIRPAGMSNVILRTADWSKLLEMRDRGRSTLLRVEEYLEHFAAGWRPATDVEAKNRLADIDNLTRQHRSAQISGYLTTIPKAELVALIALVERRQLLAQQLETELGVDAGRLPETIATLTPAIEAAKRLLSRGLKEVVEARKAEATQRSGEADLLERLGRLSALPGKLDVKGMTLGEARTLAAACDKIASRGERITITMREPGIEDSAMLENIAERRDKILNAGRILDERFGAAWRIQSPERLGRAAEIANTPGDRRHANVFDYARSLGIDAKIPQALDGAAKTLRATERLMADQSLLHAFPATFKGVDTDVELLREAAAFIAELRHDLAGVRGGDALLAVFRTNSRRVMSEFIGYAALHLDIDALGHSADTPIDGVYGLHRSELAELGEDAGLVERTGKNVSGLMNLSNLAELHLANEAALYGNHHYQACGVYHPEEITNATNWLANVAELTGSAPQGDEQLARWVIIARDAQQAVAELVTICNGINRMIGNPDHGELMFAHTHRFFDLIDGLKELVFARALVCRTMDDVSRSGLDPFTTEAASAPISHWEALLDERYALLDKLLADDAFAADLSLAVDAADQAAGSANTPTAKTGHANNSPGWIEEEIFVMPASRQTEAA